jgi:hypothetical protein
MPPKGKSALTAEEIVILIRWVQMGAPFPEAPPAVATADAE